MPQHEGFAEALIASENARWFWARWLSENRGLEVRLPPMTIADNYKDWKKHADDGDLFARKKGEDKWARYEVKHLGVEFENGEWPFPNFIVADVAVIERATQMPSTYFCLDKSMNYCAYLNVQASRDSWFQKRIYNSKFDINQTFYYAPLQHVNVIPVEQSNGKAQQ